MSREIDVLVAEKVMGWKWHRCHEKNPQGETVYHFLPHYKIPPEWWESPTAIDGSPPPEKMGKVLHCVFALPPYSTDPAADYEVLKHVREKWAYSGEKQTQEAFWNGLLDVWQARPHFKDVYATELTYQPGDYSLAALRALNVELPKENA